MNEQFLVFTLDKQRCALRLSKVERVLRAVEVTTLPGANLPPSVRGVVNVHGTVLPVFELRESKILQAVEESDQMILVALRDEKRALILCDDVQGVQEVASSDIASHEELLPQSMSGQGDILTIAGELVYVNDLDALLEGSVWRQLETSETQLVPSEI